MAKSRVFKTGAKRDNDDSKALINNLKGYTRLRFGYHMKLGSLKYGDNNWEKGMPTLQYMQSLDRHWAMFMECDDSEDHLSAILFNLQGIMINEQKNGTKANHYFLKNNGRRRLSKSKR